MEYRKLPHGEEEISIIGLGTSVMGEVSVENVEETVSYALDVGINYFDLAAGHANVFDGFGKAIKGRRKDAYLQMHFGADYSNSEYGWNNKLDSVKASIDWQLEKLGTDYIDFGFMHCIDEMSDLMAFDSNGLLKYLFSLRDQGIVKHLGLSTHTPEIANVVLDTGIIDMMMFSINPMYDYGQGEYAKGSNQDRWELYRRCELEGVGISVMKPFNGGILLKKELTPFEEALTTTQCIAYALDKPGVLTCVQGARNVEELKENLHFLEATRKEKDYSIIGKSTPKDIKGHCVYCRHCQPCPINLPIALMNKYYDLAMMGDQLAIEHYKSLDKKATSCLNCGQCNQKCPFGVDQRYRMREIKTFFSMVMR